MRRTGRELGNVDGPGAQLAWQDSCINRIVATLIGVVARFGRSR
jgi:hypothetical protein